MAKSKQSLKHTLQLIVDILSPESSDAILKHHLEHSNIDWDAIVIVASKHLVLPAVYCRLKQRSLLNYLPNDLTIYLEKLTQLNRERNQSLLNETKQITTLFKAHKINHVFVKGIALLAGNYFQDIGERMIGDVDILVDSQDIDKAFDVLVDEGYANFINFNYEIKNYRHRPRQISEEYIGAIELHDQLLKHDYNHLIDKNSILSEKEIVNEIAIPSSKYLIWNTILAQQINDKAFYYNAIRLKGIYDVLSVGLSHKKELIKDLSLQKYSLGFLNLASVFCPALTPSKETLRMTINKNALLFSLNFPKFGYFMFKIKAIFIALGERFSQLFLNKSYREHVYKSLFYKKP